MGLLTRVSPISGSSSGCVQVRPPAVFVSGFFEGRQSVPGVSHCVISRPPALMRHYRGRELLAFGCDLTVLVAPSSAPSCLAII